MIQNLIDKFNAATEQQFQEGLNWYPMVNAFAIGAANKYGTTMEDTAAMIAVLSPQLRWDANELALIAILEGQRPVAVMGTSVAKAEALYANAKSATPLDIWDVEYTNPRSGKVGKAIGGLKVTSFCRNILDPVGSQDVTCDSHMVEAYLGRTATAQELSALGRRKFYAEVSDAITDAAKLAGLAPLDYQAIVWLVQKETKEYEYHLHKINNHSGHVIGKV